MRRRRVEEERDGREEDPSSPPRSFQSGARVDDTREIFHFGCNFPLFWISGRGGQRQGRGKQERGEGNRKGRGEIRKQERTRGEKETRKDEEREEWGKKSNRKAGRAHRTPPVKTFVLFSLEGRG